MGDAVRWGITNKVDAWEKCCEQCLNFLPSPGKPTCNGEAASPGAPNPCLLCHVLGADLILAHLTCCGVSSVGLVWRQGRLR